METIQEDVYERANIRFPKPLTLEKSEEMLKFVSAALPGEVRYEASYGVCVGRTFSAEDPDGLSERLGVSLSGVINRREGDYAFDSFRCSNSERDLLSLVDLTFNVIPGYSLREHRPEVVRLWDDVRQHVRNYFAHERNIADSTSHNKQI